MNNSINDGVTFAGRRRQQQRQDCNYSPAGAAAAITVGSTTSSDSRSPFSNYGSCLDVLAPGSSITWAWHTGNTATNTISEPRWRAPTPRELRRFTCRAA